MTESKINLKSKLELIKECRATNKFKQAEVYYNMLEYLPESQKEHKLFIMNHIYDHSLYSEMVINYYYLAYILFYFFSNWQNILLYLLLFLLHLFLLSYYSLHNHLL